MIPSSQARIVIPARRGVAHRLPRHRIVSIINTHGAQVVDTWAFNAADTSEFMSMEHSRVAMLKITPQVGDTLVSNHRVPMLTVVEDTTPGVHDTLVAACDRYRYQTLGFEGHHDNCADNLDAAMKAIGENCPEVPCPLNLFQNSPVDDAGRIEFRTPVSEAGQYISLRAEMDLIVVFSACPQDLIPVNGQGCVPTEAHFTIT